MDIVSHVISSLQVGTVEEHCTCLRDSKNALDSLLHLSLELNIHIYSFSTSHLLFRMSMKAAHFPPL